MGRGREEPITPYPGKENQPPEDEKMEEEEEITTLTTDAAGMPVLRCINEWERTGSSSRGKRSQAPPIKKLRQMGIREVQQGRAQLGVTQ